MIENVENLTGGIDTTEALEGEVTLGSGGTATTNHNELTNLDFENSGHTGFQPAGDYVEDINYVHTDNNYTNEDKVKVDILETTGDGNMFLTNDGTYKDGGSGGITEETDPTVPQYVKDITEEDINSWNNKSEFSGSYNDLMDTPTIPTIENQYTNEDKAKVDLIDNTGDGSMYLSNDGTYKEVASGGGSGALEWTPSTNYFDSGKVVREELDALIGLESNSAVLITNKTEFTMANVYLLDLQSGAKNYRAVFKAGSTFWLFKNLSGSYYIIPAEVFYAQYGSNSNIVKALSGVGITMGTAKVYAPYNLTQISNNVFPIYSTNTTAYTPSANYHPATKKYVDDLITKLKTDNNLV